LEKNANVNIKDNNQRTPLHRAAIRGHIIIAKLLVEANAHVNTKDCSGNTPLHLALEDDHIELAVMLARDHKGDVNIENNDGNTPLDMVKDEVLRRSIYQQIIS
jgi:ankyrin repeat protein